MRYQLVVTRLLSHLCIISALALSVTVALDATLIAGLLVLLVTTCLLTIMLANDVIEGLTRRRNIEYGLCMRND